MSIKSFPTWEHEGLMMPNMIRKDTLQYLENFEVRDDDIWLCTYPKSGTHWLMQIIYLLQLDGDYNKLINLGLFAKRSLPIELAIEKPDGSVHYSYKAYEQLDSPRLMVTHLPLKLLPRQVFEKKAKVVYVARNPKDTVVSMYHFFKPSMKARYDIDIEWDEFVQQFTSEKAALGPWPSHVLPFWNRRNEDNVLFLKYENIKKDSMRNIRKVAEFLGLSTSEEVLKNTVENSSIKRTKVAMEKERHSQSEELKVGAVVRKGIIGDWMTHFTEAQNKELDEMLKTALTGTGLEMTYE